MDSIELRVIMPASGCGEKAFSNSPLSLISESTFFRASLASWLLMNLLLTAVPRYGAYGMCTTGALLLGGAIGYYLMLPKPPLIIYIEGAMIEFELGWCFWTVLVAGAMCLFIGLIVSAIDVIWPHKFSTILEVYYDTPYDRHVILEESHDVRYRKRNSKGGLEEPVSLGSRILRYIKRFFSHRRLYSDEKNYFLGDYLQRLANSSSATSAGWALRTAVSKKITCQNPRGVIHSDAVKCQCNEQFLKTQHRR